MGNTSSRPSRLDRISRLPDPILCHILSFLPTKFAATTSVLSKRWKFVWLSVLALNFDDQAFNDFDNFYKFVNLIMFTLRDEKTSIHSFTMKLGKYSRYKQKDFNKIFKFVMERGIENLDFNMSDKKRLIKSPPVFLKFKTLQVLKLTCNYGTF
ncbi:FBD-associated F-box protein [Trifolium repens]|nr:FBD-associated F-box protein [Trifolium repens]